MGPMGQIANAVWPGKPCSIQDPRTALSSGAQSRGKHSAPSPPAHQTFPAVEVTNGQRKFTAGEVFSPVDLDPVRVK